ncbi:MAG: hypothetical protein ACI8Z1_002599 [Candidatus Azotimanducaceae bacterium]|jgi:hypothetical protein
MTQKCNIYLVAGGRFHDIQFARLELLKLLAERDESYVEVGADFSNADQILASDFLVTYTCDVRPTLAQQATLETFLEQGGRWFALHGTNSLLDFDTTNGPIEAFGVTIPGVPYAPNLAPEFMTMLGTRFVTHPPIQPFRVLVTQPDHPLVAGIEDFTTEDEPYCCDVIGNIDILLESRYSGENMSDLPIGWDNPERVHPQMYLRKVDRGEILYLTLGHCCGRFDMQPIMKECDIVKCSWELPVYYELLRRGISWGISGSTCEVAAH